MVIRATILYLSVPGIEHTSSYALYREWGRFLYGQEMLYIWLVAHFYLYIQELPYILSAVFFLLISSTTETVSPLFFGVVVDAAVTSMRKKL